jgi:hopanoid-associated phosphorylase
MILVAAGLQREARILAGSGVRVVAGGGDAARLEQELEAAAGSAAGLISMGLCGALADGLRPGDWVVGRRITPAGQTGGARRWFECDLAWTAGLSAILPRARQGAMAGSDVIIADARAKQAAHADTGAITIDMESHIAAIVAARHGLPLAAARVVSDGAERSLPKAAQAGMASDGSMDVGAVLRALARDWRQLPELIRVGREADQALRALGRGRDLLGPRLGRADLG